MHAASQRWAADMATQLPRGAARSVHTFDPPYGSAPLCRSATFTETTETRRPRANEGTLCRKWRGVLHGQATAVKYMPDRERFAN